jgi:5-methylcytosine-specific restriction endonuclease McrA
VNRRTRLARTSRLQARTGLERKSAAMRRVPLRSVSDKRRAENRERAAMLRQMFPEPVLCARPGCTRLAQDAHEPLTRARGGSITDPENVRGLCRPCHDEVTFRPESELGWAYDCGLLVHSWDANRGAA